MKNDFEELYIKFLNIKKLGFIKSKRRGTSGVGYTFEEMLNKPEDNFPIPDFNSIEIKTRRRSSTSKIHLFSASPDGDFLFPIKRVVDILGYPDKMMKNVKVFNMKFSGKYFRPIGFYKKGKIVVDYEKRKIDFVAFDLQDNNLNVDVSWSFDMLEEKLNLKLKYLAVVYANSKFIGDDEYFHYIDIKFYKLKNFETFLSMIENNEMDVCFNIGVFRDGDKIGQTHDRGVSFDVEEKDLYKLFNEIRI